MPSAPADGTVCRYCAVPHVREPLTRRSRRQSGILTTSRAMIDCISRRAAEQEFDFTVQLHDDATPAVIDNPTVAWDGPVQRIAVITIPPQKFNSPEQITFGENLSYTPWHALPEHRPVGQVNEIRKAVYLASSSLRHDTNHVARAEPTGNEH